MLTYLRYLTIAPVSSATTVILFFSFFALAVADVFGVYLLGQLISLIIQGVEDDSFLVGLFYAVDINTPKTIIIFLSGIIISYFIIKSIAGFIIQTRLLNISYGILVDMRIILMKKYLNADYLDIVMTGFSKVATKINVHCDTYIRGIYIPIMRLISDSMMLFLLCLFLFSQNPFIFPLFIFLISFFVFGYILLIKSKIYEAGKKAALSSEVFIEDIKNSVRGIRESKILGKETYYLNKFSRNVNYLADNIKIHDKYIILPKYFIEGVLISVMISLVLISVWFYGYQNNEAYVMIGYYIAAAIRIMPSINQTITSIGNMRNATYIVDELKKELVNNNASELVQSNIEYGDSIVFNDVSFSYPGTERKVLKNINIRIKKTDKVGIIGESGSGKTTFIDILSGLIIPNHGSIEIDGQTLDDTNNQSWMKKISFISQDISLFNESICENITLNENKFDQDFLNESIKKSGLSKELSKFPNGINSIIGDEGSFLSGGQKQRIGIARAFYHTRDIMILDEATTGLDVELETDILNSVYDVCANKTLFIISHNHKTLSKCNRIFQVVNGELKETQLDLQ